MKIGRRLAAVSGPVTLLLVTLCLSLPVWAERPKIGLVLGGGGARGAAHIGVLKVLEQERIPVDYIAGTSMGAIIGAFYAAGHSASEIEGILRSIDWQDALADQGPRSEHSILSKKNDAEFSIALEGGINEGRLRFPSGLLQGQRLELVLRRHLIGVSQIKSFDDLPIPFRAVATDLATITPVVFDSGDLAKVVRASMSVPGAFEPMHFEDKLLVDGGIVDNVPADVARAMGADILIVVDVGTKLLPSSELNNLGAVLNQVITGLMSAESNREIGNLGQNDVLIVPDLRDLHSAEFPKSPESIPWGEEAAMERIDALRSIAMSEAAYEEHIRARSVPDQSTPVVSAIHVKHGTKSSEKSVNAALSWQLDQPLDIDRVEHAISSVYSEGAYSRIQYELVKNEDTTDLNFDVTQKPWGPTIVEAALRVSDNFDGASTYLMSVETLTSNINSLGGRWLNRGRLGLRTGVFSEFYQPVSDNHRFFVAGSIEYAARDVNIENDVNRTLWRDRRSILAFDSGYAFGNHAEIRLGYEFGSSKTSQRVGDPAFSNFEFDYTISQLTLDYRRDTLDDAAFPRAGLLIDARVNYPLESLGADATSSAYMLDIFKPIGIGRGTFLLGLSANTLSGDGLPFQEIYTLGGLTRLSGYQPDQLFGLHTGLASLAYYRRIGGDDASLFGTPVYIGASLETGNAWLDREDVSIDTLKTAGSVFAGVSSPIGPIFLAYGRAEGGVDSFYLTIGSQFRQLPRR